MKMLKPKESYDRVSIPLKSGLFVITEEATEEGLNPLKIGSVCNTEDDAEGDAEDGLNPLKIGSVCN